MFTDGSRLDDGVAGYAVVWKKGQSWVGIETHMGYNQEAYDAECAALARAPESASRRQIAPEQVTIFTDAQAAIRRIASEEPGPGQKYALQARKHIAVRGRASSPRSGGTRRTRESPATKGQRMGEVRAEEPDAREVEWLSYLNRVEAHAVPLPRSLAHLKRKISEKKWAETRQWAGGGTSGKKYKIPKSQRPDGMVAGAPRGLSHGSTR